MPRLAVIGDPVGHSRSPAMQSAALAALGLAGEWSYGAVEATPDDFEPTVREMAAGGYAGANVTVPHKEAALAVADAADPAAAAIGAANTLVFGARGIAAHNTDAGGLLAAIAGVAAAATVSDRRPAPGPTGSGEPGGRALVLGAGGAARAAIWALAHPGSVGEARRPRLAVDVWNRTRSRAEAVYEELGGAEELRGAAVERPAQGRYRLLVNTTAVGLRGEDPFAELPLDPAGFAAGQIVVDMVYGERPSPLLAAAAEAGATTVDGLEVLVQQGARALRIWTGLEPPLDVMRAAARG